MKDLALIKAPQGLFPVSADDNDIEFLNGGIVTVEGEDRKLQDVIKILSTALGSNPIFKTYGSALPSVPGTRDIQANQKIESSVTKAIGFLAEVENSKLLSERIAGIRSLQVQTDKADKTKKVAVIVIALQNGQDLEFRRRM